MQTLLRCSYSPRVQSHASTYVRTLKISNTGSYIPLFGHAKICTHWQKWVALLLRLLCLTWVRRPELPARDSEVLKNKQTNQLTSIRFLVPHFPLFTSRALSVFGCLSTWSDLPLPLRQIACLDSFRSNLKTFLFPKL